MSKHRVRTYHERDVYFHLTKEVKHKIATMHLLGIKRVMLDLPTFKQGYKKCKKSFNLSAHKWATAHIIYPSVNTNISPGSIHRWAFEIHDN